MNYIGIIGAMDEEVSILKGKLKNIKIVEKASMEFFVGTMFGKDVVVVKSGIGKVNMAICSQILIDNFSVDVLINTGVAGSLRNEINIGDIVVSVDALQHDVDCSVFGDPIGTIPRMDCSTFVANEHLVELAKCSCEKVNTDINVHLGRVVSGDQFISDSEKKQMLISNFDGYCAEMEGASMAHVAYLNRVPFVIIRAISDKADNSAEMNYAEFEEQAIKHTVKLVSEIVEQI